MESRSTVVIAQGGFPRLRELRRMLSRVGVEASIVGPPDGRPHT
jgi:hypothetical protein